MSSPDMTEPRAGIDCWECPECRMRWIEDGEGAIDRPAECGPCGAEMTLIGPVVAVSALAVWLRDRGLTERATAEVAHVVAQTGEQQ